MTQIRDREVRGLVTIKAKDDDRQLQPQQGGRELGGGDRKE